MPRTLSFTGYSKILLMLLGFSGIAFISNAQNPIYFLDFTKPATYTYDCGRINPPMWEVSKDSCTLFTTPVMLGDSCGPVITYPVSIKINASGNLECEDRAYFWYLCGTTWHILDTIFGCNMTFVQTFTYNINCPSNQPFAIKVSFITDHNTEKLQLRNGDIVIYDACPTFLGFKLNSIDGKKTQSGNLITWEMENYSESEKLIVERSFNSKDFEQAGDELAIADLRKYEQNKFYFLDEEAALNHQYYRLKVINKNGEAHYSSIVTLKKSEFREKPLLYPNPGTGEFTLQHYISKKSENKIKILNIQGQIVYEEKILLDRGNKFIRFDMSHLANGMYFILLQNDSDNHIIKWKKE